MESYLNRTYFPGLVLKGEVGAFYRVTASWSFGLEIESWFMPQWYSNSKYNEAQIREICSLLEQHKYSNNEIAAITNLPTGIVSQVKNKRTWTNISKDYNF